ncbi:MAG: hypothetical protein KDD69_18945, partial [Bdellovibrionales bacterium]|nr:hypothetical protein [Bdellovibrionales bacterium]
GSASLVMSCRTSPGWRGKSCSFETTELGWGEMGHPEYSGCTTRKVHVLGGRPWFFSYPGPVNSKLVVSVP